MASRPSSRQEKKRSKYDSKIRRGMGSQKRRIMDENEAMWMMLRVIGACIILGLFIMPFID